MTQPTLPKNIKIAIVHDWMLTGGAEKVVEQLLELFPDAPLYLAYMSDDWKSRLAHRTVITSYMQHPLLRKYRKFLPNLRQRWFERLDLTAYDIVISSSGSEAKGLRNLKKGALHINYCHSPTHYYWVRYEEYLAHPGFGALDPLARLGLRLLVSGNRKWDYHAAQQPDMFLANSSAVQARIKKHYHRESTVVHPPVNVDKFLTQPPKTRHGFVIAGRQTPYKKFDLAIAAANEAQKTLHVIGDGPDNARLRHMAGPTVTVHGRLDDASLIRHFAESEAFIFPNEDDFGITAVEAQATGTPVIAYKAGGALDTVVDGVTGVYFDPQSVPQLADAMQRFNYKLYNRNDIIVHAQSFSEQKFKDTIYKIVVKEYKKKLSNQK